MKAYERAAIVWQRSFGSSRGISNLALHKFSPVSPGAVWLQTPMTWGGVVGAAAPPLKVLVGGGATPSLAPCLAVPTTLQAYCLTL